MNTDRMLSRSYITNKCYFVFKDTVPWRQAVLLLQSFRTFIHSNLGNKLVESSQYILQHNSVNFPRLDVFMGV